MAGKRTRVARPSGQRGASTAPRKRAPAAYAASSGRVPKLPPPPPVTVEDWLGLGRVVHASARAKAIADELSAEFEQLKALRDPHRRGAAFEGLLARLLHMSKFDVVRSAESAPSRQVDITAVSPSMLLLVEAKWQRAVVDVNELTGLLDRLDQASAGAIGVFVSMSGFTNGAVDRALDAKRARTGGHNFILLDAADVGDLVAGRIDLQPLLEDKLELLRVHNATQARAKPDRQRHRIALPPAEVAPIDGAFPALSSIAYDVVFIDGGGYAPDHSVSYTMSVPLPSSRGSLEELRALLELVHASLVLTAGGGFTVTQVGDPPLAWHGTGVEPFLACLASQRDRYREARVVRPHHSEEFALVVPFEDGWVALTGRQGAGKVRDGVRQLHLEIRMPYLPLDMSGISTLARRLRLRGIGLSSENRPLVETHWLRPWPSATPLHYGTRPLLGTDYITRGVVSNPWHGNPDAIRTPDGDAYPWAARLAQSSFIHGTLSDALAMDERVEQFSIQCVEGIAFSHVTALEVSLCHDRTHRIQVPPASRSLRRKER